MSTKSLHKILEHARIGRPPPTALLVAANEELEAIDKAAVELLGIWGYARHDIEAEKVMESIAKGGQS